MDSTKLIRDKRADLSALRDPEGIDLVLRHLEVAERHFDRARNASERDAFTDVVYRTNQVFEGILKEAYEVLTEESGSRKTPNSIEQYLVTNDVFPRRVIDYFTRYRQEWRNPATHDHRLDFNEQEAFLAISSVAAFCYVAIDQIVQELAANTVERHSREINKIDFQKPEKLAQWLAEVLPKTIKDMELDSEDRKVSEQVLVGAILGLLRSAVKDDALVINEPAFKTEEGGIRPDIMLASGNFRAIIEITRLTPKQIGLIRKGIGLLKFVSSYVNAAEAEYGLAVVLPSKLSATNLRDFTTFESELDGVTIIVVHPVVREKDPTRRFESDLTDARPLNRGVR